VCAYVLGFTEATHSRRVHVFIDVVLSASSDLVIYFTVSV
jgi:hypothetical protein